MRVAGVFICYFAEVGIGTAVPVLGAVGLKSEVTPRRLSSVLPRRFQTRQFKRCTLQQPRVDSSREAALAHEISGVLRGRAPKRLFFRASRSEALFHLGRTKEMGNR